MAINADVQARYEARIDELFAGEEPQRRGGIIVLVRSDILSLLGYRDQPLELAELRTRQKNPSSHILLDYQ